MQTKMVVGMYNVTQEGITMNVKAAVALKYGDIVTLTGTTQDSTQPYLIVTQSAADSIALVGVVCQLGGIAANGIGEITVFGVADCNVASAAYTTPGAIICTNGGGAGSGAVGTPAAGKNVGMAIGDVTGTVTQTRVFVNCTNR